MPSCFDNVSKGVPFDGIAFVITYLNDTSPQKVDLIVGKYRADDGKPWVLPIVRKLEKIIAEDSTLNHEYLPALGLDTFTRAATKLLLGETNKAVIEGQAFGIQSLSGTGALRVGATFLKMHLNRNVIYISDPSWGNHALISKHTGFEHIKQYRYWDTKNKCFDFEGMCEDLKAAPENAVVILHACAHNPTGCDPSQEQWKKLSEIVKEKKLFPFFDCAYQGFASGDLEKDSWAVRYFANEGHELFCSQSFAKNFGLYDERVGNLTVIVSNKDKLEDVKSQFQLVVRAMYSNPPRHGAHVVSAALTTPEYFKDWQDNISTMTGRMALMRKGLREKLEAKTQAGAWKHVTDQIGMFSYTGLTAEAAQLLRDKYHIYLLNNGRINVCGLNRNNIDYVADSIVKVLEDLKTSGTSRL